MRKLLWILFLIFTATLAKAQTETLILGAWNLETITQADGTVLTPAQMGHSTQLQFLADGSFARLHDGSLVAQGQWQLSHLWVEINGAMVCLDILITTTGDEWHQILGVPWSVLELDSGPLDMAQREAYSFLAPTADETPTLDGLKACYR